MKAKETIKVIALAALVAFFGTAALAAGGFASTPSAAKKALKASVGKPISRGWVFIEGKYIPPPYKVMRLGTVIRINEHQVTGEIIPWEEFVKTQDASKIKRTQTGGGAAESEAAAEPEPEPEPESEPDLLSSDDDDWESSLDDLFGDDSAPKKSSSGKSQKSGYKPRPKKPTVTVTYSLEGEFEPNAKSQALLAKLNDYRTKIDAGLRSGGCYFFSPRYSPVAVDAGATRLMVQKLPDIMKAADSKQSLYQAARSAGLMYITPKLAVELYKNKVDYITIQQRSRDKKDSSWAK